MKDARKQPAIKYERPAIEDLGSLTQLTAGSKFNSWADFQNGQPPTNGGPGS
jgi:hypothetical protein